MTTEPVAAQELPASQLAEIREELRLLRAELATATERINAHTSAVELDARRDLIYAAAAEASLQSAHFVAEHMPSAQLFGHPHDTLRHGLSLAPQGGLALEFGVFSGSTLAIIAKERGGELTYGFDSFKGLPEDWRSGFRAGVFGTDAVPDVPGAELVIGWFDETLPGFLAEHQGPVDFLHVDADLYSSARTVLDAVGPRLRVGSVIVFDEFFNYQGWQDHEYRAWREYVERSGVEFRYEAYTFNSEQVVVSVTALDECTGKEI